MWRRAAAVALGLGTGGAVYCCHGEPPDVSFYGQAVLRSTRTLRTAALIAADYRRVLHSRSGADWDGVHLRSARRLLGLLKRNGGVYVKAGQHLAALEYLLPLQYCRVLGVLVDGAEAGSTLADVRRLLRADLGAELEDLFATFETAPMAAASLAQVHRATLRTGEEVAVKVQHPRVRDFAAVDIATVLWAVRAIKRLFPAFELDWLAAEMAANLPLELNFVQEGQNAERMASLLPPDGTVHIPRVYWKATSTRVLTMERCEGARVTDRQYLRDQRIDPAKVAVVLAELFGRMIFEHGFVHCDPHPGNVLVRRTGRKSWEVVLLDHGLYRQLTLDMRLAYAHLWKAITGGDEEEVARWSQRLGGGTAHRLFSAVLTHRPWQHLSLRTLCRPPTPAEGAELRRKAADYFTQVASLLSSLPRPLLLLLKTNDLMLSIERQLLAGGGRMPSFAVMARCCERAVYSAEGRGPWAWVVHRWHDLRWAVLLHLL